MNANTTNLAFVFVVVVFAGAAAYPLFGGKFGIDLVNKIMIFAIFALSLELLVGGTGLVSLRTCRVLRHRRVRGRAAVAGRANRRRSLWLLPASVIAAAIYAIFVGALSLRTKGVYFIMVTLAFAQMAYFVVHDTPLGGGTDGIYLTMKPVLGLAARSRHPLTMYLFTLAWLIAVFGFLAILLRSRFGRALAGIRVNEQRTRADGVLDVPVQARGLHDLGRARGACRLPVRGQGRVRQSGVDELAPVGRGADHDHPGRHRPPAWRADRRVRLRAAAGALQVRGHLRRVRQALAAWVWGS